MKDEVVRKFIESLNERDIESCMTLVADNIELRSTLAMNMFPDSGGTLKGKKVFRNYLLLIFDRMPWMHIDSTQMNLNEKSILVRDKDINSSYDYYMQYYVNDDLLIYLLKSDTTSAYK